MLDHEKLSAYSKSLGFATACWKLVSDLPHGNGELTQQLRRAASSIILNIAEGSGRFQSGDKRRFYLIARGSAMECGAVIDLLRSLEIISDSNASCLKNDLVQIVAMLTALCRLREREREKERERDYNARFK